MARRQRTRGSSPTRWPPTRRTHLPGDRQRPESFLDADGVVINPADWADLRLLKDENDDYIGGKPFSNGPVQPGETLFGKRVVVTSRSREASRWSGRSRRERRSSAVEV